MSQHSGSMGRTLAGIALLLLCGLMGMLRAPSGGNAPADDASDKVELHAGWTSRLGSADGLSSPNAGGAYKPAPAAPRSASPNWASLCSGAYCGNLATGATADATGWDAGWGVRSGTTTVADASALDALPANLVPGPFTGAQASTLNLLSPEPPTRQFPRDDRVQPLPVIAPPAAPMPAILDTFRTPETTPTPTPPAEDRGTGSLRPVDITTELPAQPLPTSSTPATPRSTDTTTPDLKHNDLSAGKPRGRTTGSDAPPAAAPSPSAGLPASSNPAPVSVPAGANPGLPAGSNPGGTEPWPDDTPTNPALNPFDPSGPLSQGLPPIPSSTPTIPTVPTVTPAPYQPLNNPTPVLERIALGRNDPADSPTPPYDDHQDWPEQAVLAAVAEPDSLALIAVALLALGLIGRFRGR